MAHAPVNTDFEAEWQNHVPAIAWGTVVLFITYVTLYGLTLWAAMAGKFAYGWATCVFSYLAYVGFTIGHDAGHGAIFRLGSRLKPLEKIMGWITSIPLLLVPYSLFKHLHDRHHAFTNDPVQDPDHFSFGGRWYQVLANSLFIPFQYHRLALTTYRNDPAIRSTLLSTVIYFLTIISVLATLVRLGFGREVLFFVLFPVVFSVIALTFFFDYLPHHPHKMLDRLHNTRVYPGALLNALLLGQNYHLIHHMYPRVPWYRYRTVFQAIETNLVRQWSPIDYNLRESFLNSPNGNLTHTKDGQLHRLLTVKKKTKVSAHATQLSFALPPNQPFRFKAGQYVLVSQWLSGQQQTRCYSLCCSAHSGELSIAVKNQENGLMSSFLNHDLQQGDELNIRGPFGDFTFPSGRIGKSKESTQHLMLFAAGSGITPLLSILETALATTQLTVELIYACHDEDSILFHSRLTNLQERYRQRFKSTFFTSTKPSKLGIQQGRLSAQKITQHLAFLSKSTLAKTDFYICGPQGYSHLVEATLLNEGIETRRVFLERFTLEPEEPKGKCHQVEFTSTTQTKMLNIAENQTLLEVALSEKLDIPHACKNGLCGSCKCKVVQGITKPLSESAAGLSLQERAAGYTLACQCKPLSDVTVEFI